MCKGKCDNDNIARFLIYSISFLSAFINISGFLEFSYSLSHYSGNLIDVVLDMFQKMKFSVIIILFGLLGCFAVGSGLAAFINKEQLFSLQKKYGIVQFCIGVILLLIYFIIPDKWIYIFTLSVILGVENGLIRSYKGLGFRTTHITGTLSDFGSFLGYYLLGDKSAGWKAAFEASLLFSFSMGTASGILIYLWLKSKIFIVAGLLYISTAALYLLMIYFFERKKL